MDSRSSNLCDHSTCTEEAVSGRLYCKHHGSAPKKGRAIQSTQEPAASSSRAVGKASESSSNDESEADGSDLSETKPTPGREPSTIETSKQIAEKKSSDGKNEILSTDSTSSLNPVVEAQSISLSLIDESTAHLLELQRSIRASDDEDKNLRIDANKINAACNCAKQIASLQRLKIEAFKAMRGKE